MSSSMFLLAAVVKQAALTSAGISGGGESRQLQKLTAAIPCGELAVGFDKQLHWVRRPCAR
jgi:hypothetical protein